MTKRAREDSYSLGQTPSKNPKLDDSESFETSKRDIIVSDALSYLEQVRLHYLNKPDVYIKFLDVMRDYNMNMYVFLISKSNYNELLNDGFKIFIFYLFLLT